MEEDQDRLHRPVQRDNLPLPRSLFSTTNTRNSTDIELRECVANVNDEVIGESQHVGNVDTEKGITETAIASSKIIGNGKIRLQAHGEPVLFPHVQALH